MKEIVYTNQFKKDLKKVSRYQQYDELDFTKVIKSLAEGNKLPTKYKDHKMLNAKLYHKANNFHYTADILVLYKIQDNELRLLRIGNHSNILGNEKGNKHF